MPLTRSAQRPNVLRHQQWWQHLQQQQQQGYKKYCSAFWWLVFDLMVTDVFSKKSPISELHISILPIFLHLSPTFHIFFSLHQTIFFFFFFFFSHLILFLLCSTFFQYSFLLNPSTSFFFFCFQISYFTKGRTSPRIKKIHNNDLAQRHCKQSTSNIWSTWVWTLQHSEIQSQHDSDIANSMTLITIYIHVQYSQPNTTPEEHKLTLEYLLKPEEQIQGSN